MREWSLIANKVESAIGGDVRSGKGLAVNADRERQRNAGGAIIAMIACVIRPSHDGVGAGARYVVTARNGRPCRRRRGSSSCYRAIEPVYLVGSACGSYADQQLRLPRRAKPEAAARVLPGRRTVRLHSAVGPTPLAVRIESHIGLHLDPIRARSENRRASQV